MNPWAIVGLEYIDGLVDDWIIYAGCWVLCPLALFL